MKYPNGINRQKNIKKNINTKRGMSFEDDINTTNSYYREINKAVIYKKPTPITLVKVSYPKRSAAKITEAYFSKPSTTDYNGIYKGKYLDFEAKECQSKTSFSFSYIHKHQIEHLERVLNHGAIAFILIRMTSLDTTYLIKADTFISFYKSTTRKSLPINWIKENGYEIISKYVNPCDYLSVIDRIYKF